MVVVQLQPTTTISVSTIIDATVTVCTNDYLEDNDQDL